MLALAAAQLRSKAEKQDESAGRKRIWVDVGLSIHPHSLYKRA